MIILNGSLPLLRSLESQDNQSSSQTYNAMEEYYSVNLGTGSLVFSFFLNVGFVVFSVAFLCQVWIKNYGVEFPNPGFQVDGAQLPNGSYTSKRPLKVLIAYCRLIWSLDPNYWVSNVGLDGYSYLYYLRCMMGLNVVLLFIALALNIPLLLTNSEDGTIVYVNTLNNSTLAEEFVRVFHVFLVSVVILYVIVSIRNHINMMYFKFYYKQNKNKNVGFLQLRTVMIQGLDPSDIMGKQLKKRLTAVLNAGEDTDSIEILGMAVVPNYKELMALEIDKRNIKDTIKLDLPNRVWINKFWQWPLKSLSFDVLENKLKKIKNKTKQLLLNYELKGCGYCIVCFNSLKAVGKCLSLCQSGVLQANFIDSGCFGACFKHPNHSTENLANDSLQEYEAILRKK